MTAPPLASIARDIERRRPGTLPKSLSVRDDLGQLVSYTDTHCRVTRARLDDDLAAAILRDAMVMATGAARRSEGWECHVHIPSQINSRIIEEMDRDHDGDPTRSLFAAFCEVFPTKETAP